MKNQAARHYNPNTFLFVDGDKEEVITIPDMSDVLCSRCASFDDWLPVDADWDEDRKYIVYACEGHVDYGEFSEKCDERMVVYLNSENKPVFPKTDCLLTSHHVNGLIGWKVRK